MKPQSLASLELFVDNRGSGLTMPIQPEIDRSPFEPHAYIGEFDGKVVSYSVIDRGNGYVGQPSITIDGGNGDGASAQAILVGGVEEILFKPSGNSIIPTPTIDITSTPTLSRSPSATPTISKSFSMTPSSTTTLTLSVTKTSTPTTTPTTTPTPTFTRTQTLTPSITPTNTPALLEHCSINEINDYNDILFSNQNTGLSAGSGFRAPPNIVFEGVGIRAEVITEVSGYIDSVDIAMAGEGYQIAPLIVVEGDGIGAKLRAKISGYIYKTFISDPGLYASGTVLNITPSSGNATFSGIMSKPNLDNGLITLLEVAIVNPGSGYDSIPKINIQAPSNQTSRAATAYCSINAGISEIQVISGGYGYTKTPKLSIIRKEPIPDENYIGNLKAKFYNTTQTPTSTPSCTITQTPSYSPPNTSTPTPSLTRTITPTFSPTLTKTPTRSPTPSVTPSDASDLIISPDSILLPTPTSSPTVTPTNSITPSPTVTKSRTPTPTVTKTKTQTPTSTTTKTPTPTLTKTSTPTSTQSPTPSITPSPSTNYPDRISYDAILIPRMSYGINKINIIDSGRYRYGNIPTLKAVPSYTAEYKAIIDDASSGFEFSPLAKIVGSTISSSFRTKKDPECLPIINYKITSAEVIDPGNDYTIPPKIILNGGYDPIKGVKAELVAQIDGSGQINSISISNSGNFYRSYPDIKILSQDSTGQGLRIRLKLTGSLEEVYITEIGQNLTPNSPNNKIIFEGGGSGVTYPQAHIVLNNSAGSGFVGTANINYHISYVKPISSGSNYHSSPSVILGEAEQKTFNAIPPRSGIIQSRIEGIAKTLVIASGGKDFSLCNVLPEFTSLNNFSPMLDAPMIMVGSKPLRTLDRLNVAPVYENFTMPLGIDNTLNSWLSQSRFNFNTGTFNIINSHYVSFAPQPVIEPRVRIPRIMKAYNTTISGYHTFDLKYNDSGFSGIYPDTVSILYENKFLEKGVDYNISYSDYFDVKVSLIKNLPSGTTLLISSILLASGNLYPSTNTIKGSDYSYSLFYEKPRILFPNSYDLSSKTYLHFAGYSASYTGTTKSSISSYSKYVSTHKIIAHSFYLSPVDTFSILNKGSYINSINHPDYGYGNVYVTNTNHTNRNDLGIYLSVEGKIKGIQTPDWSTTIITNSGRRELLTLPNFFDTLPQLTIEDEIGTNTTVNLTKNSNNNLTRLSHLVDYTGYSFTPSGVIKSYLSNPSGWILNSHDSWYAMDNFVASGIFKSDLSISDGGSDYSSRAILACYSGGIPTSWNNPPSLSITVTSGSISNITINNGGAGFGQSLITDNLPSGVNNGHLIYFSGGGGYGASGILLSSWPGSGNPYTNKGSITGILLLNSGTGYYSAPSPIIVDGSPTWNNIEYNNRILNYDNRASMLISWWFHSQRIGILPTIDFYFKDSFIAECKPLVYLQPAQISEGFISCARDGSRAVDNSLTISEYNENLNSNAELGLYRSWIRYIDIFNGVVTKDDPYRIHNHYNNGEVDDILVGYITPRNIINQSIDGTYIFGYGAKPNITISNSGAIFNSSTITPPGLRAELPQWKNIFSDTTLMRMDDPID